MPEKCYIPVHTYDDFSDIGLAMHTRPVYRDEFTLMRENPDWVGAHHIHYAPILNGNGNYYDTLCFVVEQWGVWSEFNDEGRLVPTDKPRMIFPGEGENYILVKELR